MPADLSRLAVHTITTRPWSTEQCIEKYARAGVRAITFWRHSFEARDPARVGAQARESGLQVAAVARGGFFTSDDWWSDNCRALDEAAACGAPVLILVCGAKPSLSLADARSLITERLAALVDYAAERTVTLAIEPLHPMYAADRSAINTLGQAHAVCDALGSPPNVGIAVDVYHTWWDSDLEAGIRRAGALGRLASFHVCDWLAPTTDLLNDRGLMGEGCIDIPSIRSNIESTGFGGWNEVEIFSNRWWAADQDQFLERIVAAYTAHC